MTERERERKREREVGETGIQHNNTVLPVYRYPGFINEPRIMRSVSPIPNPTHQFSPSPRPFLSMPVPLSLSMRPSLSLSPCPYKRGSYRYHAASQSKLSKCACHVVEHADAWLIRIAESAVSASRMQWCVGSGRCTWDACCAETISQPYIQTDLPADSDVEVTTKC